VIETWQLVALGLVVVAGLSYLQYRTWRTARRDAALFDALERRVAHALSTEGYALSGSEHAPKSFGNRRWTFSGDGSQVQVYWSGRDREIVVMLESTDPAIERMKVALSEVPFDGPVERYEQALDSVVGSAVKAARTASA
jgi:hypothetical protein